MVSLWVSVWIACRLIVSVKWKSKTYKDLDCWITKIICINTLKHVIHFGVGNFLAMMLEFCQYLKKRSMYWWARLWTNILLSFFILASYEFLSPFSLYHATSSLCNMESKSSDWCHSVEVDESFELRPI